MHATQTWGDMLLVRDADSRMMVADAAAADDDDTAVVAAVLFGVAEGEIGA